MLCRAVVVTLLLINVIAAQPARSQSPSPDTLAAAKELIVTMRATDQMKAVLPIMMQQLKPVIAQGRAEIERDYDASIPQILAAADARMGELVESMSLIYAQNFTADELRQISTFYKGPVGQKFLQIMPKIMQDSMAVGQKFGEALVEDLRTKMTDELRKKGHKM